MPGRNSTGLHCFPEASNLLGDFLVVDSSNSACEDISSYNKMLLSLVAVFQHSQQRENETRSDSLGGTASALHRKFSEAVRVRASICRFCK